MIPFCPQYGSNQNVTATSTPAVITINKDSDQIRIANSGSAAAYIAVYDSAGTALTAGVTMLPVFPNSYTTITKSLSHDRLSHYSATSTTLSIMTGRGI